MHATVKENPVYGLMAEFKESTDLVKAAESARLAGYKNMDAYSPIPVHGLAEAIGFHDSLVPWIIFIAGVTGACSGYSMQWWINVVAYPLNAGGKPFISWPNFIPVTFECTILFAAFGAVISMLALNGLPRPHHPIFNGPRFELASQDRFFLCIESKDPKFDMDGTAKFLAGLNPQAVAEVPN